MKAIPPNPAGTLLPNREQDLAVQRAEQKARPLFAQLVEQHRTADAGPSVQARQQQVVRHPEVPNRTPKPAQNLTLTRAQLHSSKPEPGSASKKDPLTAAKSVTKPVTQPTTPARSEEKLSDAPAASLNKEKEPANAQATTREHSPVQLTDLSYLWPGQAPQPLDAAAYAEATTESTDSHAGSSLSQLSSTTLVDSTKLALQLGASTQTATASASLAADLASDSLSENQQPNSPLHALLTRTNSLLPTIATASTSDLTTSIATSSAQALFSELNRIESADEQAPASLSLLTQSSETALAPQLSVRTHTPDLPSIHAPVASEGFTTELTQQVQWLVSKATLNQLAHTQHEAQLNLNPVELGPLTIRLTLEGQQAHIDFAALSGMTRQAIDQTLPSLTQSLQDIGITLSGGGVTADLMQQRQSAQDQSNAYAAPSAQPARVITSLASSTAESTLPGGRVPLSNNTHGGLDVYV